MLVEGFTVIEGQMRMLQLNRYLEKGNKIMNNALCLLYEIYSRSGDLQSECTIQMDDTGPSEERTHDEESGPQKYV